MAEQAAPNQLPQRPLASGLRKPPSAGGPKRVPEELPAAPAKKPSAFKRALPYLLPAVSTGTGIGIGWLFL